MKRDSRENDNATLGELARALRAIARKRKGIAGILNAMAMNYEARPAHVAVRVSVARRPPYTFREP